jgi:hypothetical protein
MAALTTNQCFPVWRDGLSDTTILYSLRNITTGDTADLSADFSALKLAALVGTTVLGAAQATVTGNSVTIPAGVSHDAAWLLAWGVHA